jgi:addiction module HigA family antidote
MTKQAAPVHPGTVLNMEFLEPNNLSPGKLAKGIDVPRTRIERVVAGKTPITTDTALRLSKFFGNTAQFWLNLQSHYDLLIAERALAKKLAKIDPFKTAA